ncbi:2-dehydropantoate 2-reductase [Paenibacillus shirakamiensis]|uniref:2-dehydropantoate 2-reductase n=1 Tax=Paenibacillus shirakamiensis TaxID=1265935 RepID=A0ABS4JBW0_9BACL|nr:2-dehydropantoate 2-reductase [Paenibacillus shirakamiensis]MBP1999204.1 2-dehydropantoate 2-reductase [Paenibacillus shirakamiensis]
MKFEVIGAGAIGLLFGGELAYSGHEVHFWTRTKEQADYLHTHGLEIEIDSTIDRHYIEGLSASSTSEVKVNSPLTYPDWMIVALKQRHLNDAIIQHMQKRIGPTTKIICLLNGVGHMERLGIAFPESMLIAAITTEGSKRLGATSIKRSKPGYTRLGVPKQPFNHSQGELRSVPQSIEILAEALTLAGIPSISSNDIDKEIYRKLLINAAINPLTAIWRVPNGELLGNDQRREVLTSLIQEILTIYDCNGLYYEESMIDLVFQVCKDTQNNTSSMLKDILAGEPTEIDQIVGHLLSMADSVHVEVPLLRDIYRLVAAI